MTLSTKLQPQSIRTNMEFVSKDGEKAMFYHADLGWCWAIKRLGDWEVDDYMTRADVSAELLADPGAWTRHDF